MKKYEFTGKIKTVEGISGNVTLHRIRAIKSFGMNERCDACLCFSCMNSGCSRFYCSMEQGDGCYTASCPEFEADVEDWEEGLYE